MANLKCKNCGNVFSEFVDKEEDIIKKKCPKCKSHFIAYLTSDGVKLDKESIGQRITKGIQSISMKPKENY